MTLRTKEILQLLPVLHNFIRIHDKEDVGFGWDEYNLGKLESNAVAIAVKKTQRMYMMR